MLARVAESESRIGEQLRQRGEHDENKGEFMKWLLEAEKELMDASRLCSDLEGKENAVEKCNVRQKKNFF